MTFDFIFSAWWQFIGSFLLTAIFFMGFHALNVRLDDEVEEEEVSTYKANSWEFRAVKRFK